MKSWQVNALKRIDVAAAKLKRQIIENDGDWENVGGEINLRVAKTTENKESFYRYCTISSNIWTSL